MTKVYRYQFTKKERDYMISTMLDDIETVWTTNELRTKDIEHFKDKLEHWKNDKRGHR